MSFEPDLDVEPTDDQGEVIQFARETVSRAFVAGRDFAFNATNTMRGRLASGGSISSPITGLGSSWCMSSRRYRSF